MNVFELIIAIILLIVFPYIGFWKLFEKANIPGWKGIIPIYNFLIIIKLTGRPLWWIVLILIPGVNFLVAIGLTIDFIKSFGKFTMRQQAAGILLPFIYLPKWGFDQETTYLGQFLSPEFKDKYQIFLKKSVGREWAEAIIFAVVAATLIRTFFIEAYVIPTPSMERSLLVGDFLFVSKVNYGPRTPMTPIAFPFAHHTMPLINTKAYWDGVKLPYYRLPGLSDIKKGDVVVFNYPMDADSPLYRPVDKRENYIKRCQGTPGDTLSVVDGQVFVNGKVAPNPPGEQMEYNYITNGVDMNQQILDDLHVQTYPGHNFPAMTQEAADVIKKYSNIKSFKLSLSPKGITDPNNPVYPTNENHPVGLKLNGKQHDYGWSVDNYGPIIIPKKGWTIKLDSINFPLYIRAIKVYENNDVKIVGNDIIINGKKTDTYTFKSNYFWMMGDNRHDSDDSRFWGFVPEDHIVGKALFIWMSFDENESFINKIRWSRLFRGIK